MKTTIKLLSLLAPLALAACTVNNQEPLPPPAAAYIESFTTSAASVAQPGDMVTLSWSVVNATALTLEQVGEGPVDLSGNTSSGSVTVKVDADSTFLLTARGEGGSDVRAVLITVAPQPGALVFTAIPATIDAGGSATLVWNAPQASSATIEEVGGAMLDLGGQVETGSVRVSPTKTAQYQLSAGGKTATVTVTVDPVIVSFGILGGAAAPGGTHTLSWQTLGATEVTLTRVGESAPLLTETDPAKVAQGTFDDTVPATLPSLGVLVYTLEAKVGTQTVSTQLQVRASGNITIDTFTVPRYVLEGTDAAISWSTTNGESLELWVAGRKVFVASTQAEVNSKTNFLLPAPSAMADVELVVRNSLGAEARATKPMEPVGTITFNSFTADKATIAAGGEVVTLSWSVTNAREVTITETTGRGYVRHFFGPGSGAGTLQVYPNRATTTYELTATNLAGQNITPATVDVAVTTPVTLAFDANLPPGATVNVTGTSDSSITTIAGLPQVEKNPTGEAFIDISQTGTSISATSGTVVTMPEGEFRTTIYGEAVALDRFSVSRYGFMIFRTSSWTGTGSNTATIGTTIQPLTIAPYWRSLETPANSRFWQRDVVADGERLIVQWNAANYTNEDAQTLTFQAQIYSSGKIVFAYKDFNNLPAVDGTVGITNGTETDEVTLTAPVADGDVYRFFGPATLPAPLKVYGASYGATAFVNGEPMEVEGDPQLTPGRFGITEVNPNPAAGVTDGEWVEVTNNTGSNVNLGGWDLNLAGTLFSIPMGTTLPANGRLLFAQAADLGVGFTPPSGVTVVTYPNTNLLPDTAGAVGLEFQGGTYSSASWSTSAAGVSIKQNPVDPQGLTYASGVSGPLSCSSVSGSYGTPAQTGTPGLSASSCFPYTTTVSTSTGFVAIATTGTVLGSGSTGMDSTVWPITLTRPVTIFGRTLTQLWVSTNGFVGTTALASSYTTNKSSVSTSAPTGVLAPFWDDLNGHVAASGYPGSVIAWQEFDPDSTPNNGDEYTIISWEDVQHWGSTYLTQHLFFQVVIRANGNIEYHYATMEPGTASLGASYASGGTSTVWLDTPDGRAASVIVINTASTIAANSSVIFSYTP